MKKSRIATALIITALMTVLGGCAVTVTTPPPAARVEVLPPVPFRGAVWIDGYYVYRHDRYIWQPGRYVKPPRHGSHWVPGRWHKHRRGWRWNKGHWR